MIYPIEIPEGRGRGGQKEEQRRKPFLGTIDVSVDKISSYPRTCRRNVGTCWTWVVVDPRPDQVRGEDRCIEY